MFKTLFFCCSREKSIIMTDFLQMHNCAAHNAQTPLIEAKLQWKCINYTRTTLHFWNEWKVILTNFTNFTLALFFVLNTTIHEKKNTKTIFYSVKKLKLFWVKLNKLNKINSNNIYCYLYFVQQERKKNHMNRTE